MSTGQQDLRYFGLSTLILRHCYAKTPFVIISTSGGGCLNIIQSANKKFYCYGWLHKSNRLPILILLQIMNFFIAMFMKYLQQKQKQTPGIIILNSTHSQLS